MGPKRRIPAIKKRPKTSSINKNDQFLIISNNKEDELNTNNNFTTYIQPINTNSSYRVVLTDFHYSLNIKHEQGNFKITLANITENESK